MTLRLQTSLIASLTTAAYRLGLMSDTPFKLIDKPKHTKKGASLCAFLFAVNLTFMRRLKLQPLFAVRLLK